MGSIIITQWVISTSIFIIVLIIFHLVGFSTLRTCILHPVRFTFLLSFYFYFYLYFGKTKGCNLKPADETTECNVEIRKMRLIVVCFLLFKIMDKIYYLKLWIKFQFDHTNKWYMHNPAPVQENHTCKLLWDFNIQTDHLIPARRPDLIIISKKKKKRKFVKLSTLLSGRTTE